MFLAAAASSEATVLDMRVMTSCCTAAAGDEAAGPSRRQESDPANSLEDEIAHMVRMVSHDQQHGA